MAVSGGTKTMMSVSTTLDRRSVRPSPEQPHTPGEAARLNKAAMAARGYSFRS
jgi:hypothetical protein